MRRKRLAHKTAQHRASSRRDLMHEKVHFCFNRFRFVSALLCKTLSFRHFDLGLMEIPTFLCTLQKSFTFFVETLKCVREPGQVFLVMHLAHFL